MKIAMMNTTKHRRIAVVTACDLIRTGVLSLLNELGIEVEAAPDAAGMRQILQVRSAPHLIVGDVWSYADVQVLAAERHLPMLLIAPTMISALGLVSSDQVQGILSLPVSRELLSEAVDTLLMGERFTSFDVTLRFPDASLSLREQELVGLELQDVPIEEIGRWMGIAIRTIYTYRCRIRKKLRQIPLADLPEWASIWLRRFPGL